MHRAHRDEDGAAGARIGIDGGAEGRMMDEVFDEADVIPAVAFLEVNLAAAEDGVERGRDAEEAGACRDREEQERGCPGGEGLQC